jgi:hypothetical protein
VFPAVFPVRFSVRFPTSGPWVPVHPRLPAPLYLTENAETFR